MKTMVTLLILFTLLLPNTFAQDYTQWGSPEVIKTRRDKGEINEIAYSPDGTRLAVATSFGICLYDAYTGAEVSLLTGHTGWVQSVSFSPEGTTIASGAADNTIRLWDAQTGAPKRTLTGHTSWVDSVSFSPDGTTIVSGSSDNTIRLWDAQTGLPKHTLTGTGGVQIVSFSPDGTTIASGSREDTVRLWDAQTGAPKRTLTGHTGWVDSVSFSPDGTTIASGSRDKTIRLWDVQTGAPKHTLTGHKGWIISLSFSPDGTTIASGSLDKTIRLWDAQTGAPKHTLTGHTSMVVSVLFSPDGTTLASANPAARILLWKLTPSSDVKSTVSVSPSPVPSPAIGEQLPLSLKISGGENVAGYQATVQYDTSALRYVSSANGNYLPVGALVVPAVVSGNRVTLTATSPDGESHGDGTLATLTFEVIAVKASTLTLSDVVLFDSAGAGSRPQVENGEVVEPPQVTGDVNRDGVVNVQDLVLVAGALGNTAAAPALHPQALTMLTVVEVQAWLTQAQQIVLTDPTYLHGIAVLEQLLAALMPKETILLHNYPNPFNPETWIPYHLAHAADVHITIYDIKGAVVRELDLGHQQAAYYADRAKAAYWDGRNESGESVASGIYFYQLHAGRSGLSVPHRRDYSATKRMAIIK